MRRYSFREVALIAICASVASVSCVSCLDHLRSGEPLSPVSITSASVASDEQNNIEIYRSLSPGVVHITSTVAVRGFFGVFPQQGTGSGSIIDNQGHILTNYHVVRDARRLDVTLADKSAYRATFVGGDPDNDIAIIKINAPSDRLRVIQLGTSSNLSVGQKAIAIGNPFGLDRTLTTGVISGLDRPLSTENGQVIEKVIQTDASINPGNSGGPLLDKDGKIIGINTAIYSPSGGSVGIGFAIPIDIAKNLLPELLANGKIRKGYLGITTVPLTPALAQELNLAAKEGVIVVDAQKSGPAADAGLRGMPREDQVGDVILTINGQPIKDPGDLARTVSAHKPGEKITLGILRQGNQQQLEVTLGERPAEVPDRKQSGLFDGMR